MERLCAPISFLFELFRLPTHADRLARMRLQTKLALNLETEYFRLQVAVLRERVTQVKLLESALGQALAQTETDAARKTVMLVFQAALRHLDHDIEDDLENGAAEASHSS